MRRRDQEPYRFRVTVNANANANAQSLPESATASVEVVTYSQDYQGRIIISWDFSSEKEIDEYVDLLIKDLELARRKGKKDIRRRREQESKNIRQQEARE